MSSSSTDLLSTEPLSAKRVDLSKRASFQSGISEFSFEHNDESSFTNNANPTPAERNASPGRPAGRIEQIVKKNTELEKQSAEQNTLISALRLHIQSLEKKLRDNAIDVPPFTEPAILKDTVIRSLNIEPNPSKSLEKLHLPPRSADRMRTPLRSPSSQRSVTTRAHEALEQLDESTEADTSTSTVIQNNALGSRNDDGIDLNADYDEEELTSRLTHQMDNSLLAEPTSPSSEVISLSEEKGDHTIQETILDAAAPVRANVDWNATIEALKSSADEPEDGEIGEVSDEDEEPVVQTVETKVQMTPYSGRIASPSPFRSSKDALSPTSSQFSTSISITQIDRNPHLTPSGNGSESPTNYKMQPVSPIRLSAQRNGSMRSISASQAASIRSPVTQEHMPLSKTNLYDPYATDFHQQAYRDYTQLSTPQSSHFPNSPQDSKISNLLQPPTPTYPSDVPLFVDPSHISTVKPEVISTIHGNPTKKSDDPFVSIAILDRQTNKEMWRFRKSLSQILKLDAEIRPMINTFSLPPVPEKSLFLTNAPVKVDSRRSRIKDYFATLFAIPNIPLDAAYKVVRFMSLDVINLLDESNMDVVKEGWLLRRTKGLGSAWKARYCQIDGPYINVYESPNGSVLEIIKLTGSQIGRQPDDLKISDDKSAFRHAFAVLEPKKAIKTNSFTKHIFCAETDIDRDLWVNVLVQLLDDGGSARSIYSVESTMASSMNTPKRDVASPDNASSFSPSKATMSSSTSIDFGDQEQQEREARRQKKRSFFPFSKKQITDDSDYSRQQEQKQQEGAVSSILTSNIEKSLQDMNLSTGDPISKTVFQNELSKVVALSSHGMFGVNVPSIVFRCLSYLIERSAVYEEGLFRLSGSSAMIKQLRGDFDRSHDIDFKQLDPRPDINTIAGLLKLWFRELPSNILTKEVYPSFKNACDKVHDPSQLAREFERLVKTLPQDNYAVLYVLFKFLNDVIRNKDSNKMNLKNLCIVFSPTLNIAADIIVPFLVDFKCVFENGDPISAEEREAVDLNIPTF